jgi:hypothetical protein
MEANTTFKEATRRSAIVTMTRNYSSLWPREVHRSKILKLRLRSKWPDSLKLIYSVPVDARPLYSGLLLIYKAVHHLCHAFTKLRKTLTNALVPSVSLSLWVG